MKRTPAIAILSIVIGLGVLPGFSQSTVDSGPWKHFRQEHPPLSYVEIKTPIAVRTIDGVVTYQGGKPLEGAFFEIGLKNGWTLSSDTDHHGAFQLREPRMLWPFVRTASVSPGTYRFKVTKDGFHSTVGTIVVSRKAPKDSSISIDLVPTDKYLKEEARKAIPPDEQLVSLDEAIPVLSAREHKQYPQKYSSVFMPVSLAEGRVRTPEFSGSSEWYDIVIQVEKPLPFRRMECMMGVTSGPLEKKDCSSTDPVLRADWTVWEGGKIVRWGSITEDCGCKFTDDNIYKLLGSFPLEASKKYVVQVHFRKDGSQLDVAHPRLIVIPHDKMW